MLNIFAAVVAGIVASLVFSMFTGMARAMGMTTMSIEKTLGAMFGEGSAAAVGGWAMHLASGVIFALMYAVAFDALGATNGWLVGAEVGLVHGLITGAVIMPMVGMMHPAVKAGRIKAPGLFAINAGAMTPMGLVVGHIIFGAVLGGIYLALA